MRPGQIPAMPEPADESISPGVNCPNCGGAWHVNAAACGNCGWRLPDEEQEASTPCPLCHQSKPFDSLTRRCTRCQPIQIKDLQPELQAYAGRAQYQRYKEFAVGMLLGPAAIAICAYYSKGIWSTPLIISLIVTPIIMGVSVNSLRQKGQSLLRYYRLGFVLRYGKPIDAELQYAVSGGGRYSSSTHYFNLVELGPYSVWPSSIRKKIIVDIPAKEAAALVGSRDKWQKFFKGFDPFEKPALWAKVYFDPNESGSAVIRIADGVFVSVTDNRPPADLFS